MTATTVTTAAAGRVPLWKWLSGLLLSLISAVLRQHLRRIGRSGTSAAITAPDAAFAAVASAPLSNNWYPLQVVIMNLCGLAYDFGMRSEKPKPHPTTPKQQTPEANVALRGPQVKVSVRLVQKENLSHNVRRFRLALPDPTQRLGLPVGKHFSVACVDTARGDEVVSRAYTPTTGDEVVGYVDLVVKIYWANEHPKFPQGGRLSQLLEALKIGDAVTIKGPIGKWEYLGKGDFSYSRAKHHAKRLNMIAGGTGITPMLQVMYAVLRDASDPTQIALLFANQSPEDILLREELDKVARQYPNRVKVWYTVDRVEGAWDYSTGFINADMCREHLYAASDTTATLLCGPPPMLKFACHPSLEKLGHAQDSIYSF